MYEVLVARETLDDPEPVHGDEGPVDLELVAERRFGNGAVHMRYRSR